MLTRTLTSLLLLLAFEPSPALQSASSNQYVIHRELVRASEAAQKCGEAGNSQLACLGNTSEDLLSLFGTQRGHHLGVWVRNCSSTKGEVLAAEIENRFPGPPEVAVTNKATEAKLPFACRKSSGSQPSKLLSEPLKSGGAREDPPTPTTSMDATTIEITSTTKSLLDTTTGGTGKNLTKISGCPLKEERGLRWEAEEGEVHEQPCPGDAKGNATWTCISGDKWEPDHPDLSDCTSGAIANFLTQLPHHNAAFTSRLLRAHAGMASYGGDLVTLVLVVENVTDQMDYQMRNVTSEERRNWTTEVALDITRSVSDLLENINIWQDLPQMMRSEFVSKLLRATEGVGFYLGEVLDTPASHHVEESNLFLEIVKQQRGAFANQPLSFPFNGTEQNRITMPPGFEEDLVPANANHTLAVFVTYKELRSILPDEHHRGLMKTGRQLNSVVVSLSFVQTTDRVLLSSPLRYQLIPSNRLADRPACVFWNFRSMMWDGEGCSVEPGNNKDETVCVCDHLTNFAVLMDIQGIMPSISESHRIALETITYVGCALSIVCLFLCIVVHTVYSSLNSVRTTIARNICLSLLMGEVLLLAGLDRTEIKIVCAVVAAFLHYFFLAAFCWMLLEAFYLYILLYKVFPSARSYYHRYYLFGYGTPLVIVGCSAAIFPDGYGTVHACWLSSSNGFTWAYTAPVLVILLVNACALAFAVRTATRVSSQHSKSTPQGTKTMIKSAVVLLPLLGLTWLPGFLFFNEGTVAMAYVFSVLNVTQGVAIFICRCCLNPKVRECVKKSFSVLSFSSRIRPSDQTDNRSKGTTQQARKGSGVSFMPNASRVFGSNSSSYRLSSHGSNKAVRDDSGRSLPTTLNRIPSRDDEQISWNHVFTFPRAKLQEPIAENY